MFPIIRFLGIRTELNTSNVDQSMTFIGHPYPIQIQHIHSFQPTEGVIANRPLTHDLLSETDRQAAIWAWQYIQRNWQPNTGFVNSVEQYPWTTWWDQGSAVLGIHAAYQLGVISSVEFDQKITRFLKTLKTLPLPPTELPNKFYSTDSAQMRTGSNRPDVTGGSGWSVLDMARFLLSLHLLRTHYPRFSQSINDIVRQWQLSKLEHQGWLQGSVPSRGRTLQLVQEGRFGYEQYAAHCLLMWGIDAFNARHSPKTRMIEVENVPLHIDQRNLANSNGTNALTSDPYILWGLELGWNWFARMQAQNIVTAQQRRYERTNVLTAVNEDSIDRPPYFLYYSVYGDGQAWNATSSDGKTYPQFRQLSTKAAFSWTALFPDHSYADTLRQSVQFLADKNKGYLAGRYENDQLGVNTLFNINTNAVILESLLYKACSRRSLVKP